MTTERERRSQTVRCLIPHAAAPRVLVVPLWAGGWELPRAEVPQGWWFPDALALVADQVRERLGLRATVLRHLQDNGPDGTGAHLCELEGHDPRWRPPVGSVWTTLEELRARGAAGGEHEAALARWFGERGGTVPVPAIRPPWQRRGWYDAAVAWADGEIARLGGRRTGEPWQIKGAWCGSTLLRLPTSEGDLYLKESYRRPPPEPALVAALAEHWPADVPELVAVDAGDYRMLMRDFGPGRLRGAPVPRWENAARRFAALQAEWAAYLDRWLALGCEDRRPGALPGLLERLLADTPSLGVGRPWGLTGDEVARVRAAVPALADQCASLAAAGVPDSLVQQDFRDGNLAVVEEGAVAGGGYRFVFYDWGDAVVGHPFFCGVRMQDYLHRPYAVRVRGPSGVPAPVVLSATAHRRYVRDAYLEPWTTFAPAAGLRAAFRQARRLNPLWQTLRWWLERRFYEDTSPWGAAAATWAPAGLRRVLSGDALDPD